MTILNKSIRITFFFTFLILLTTVVFGSSDNNETIKPSVEVEIKHQIIYNVSLNQTTNNYSVIIAIVRTIIPKDNITLTNHTIKISAFNGSISGYPIFPDKKPGENRSEYTLSFNPPEPGIIGKNEIKIIVFKYTMPNVTKDHPFFGELIMLPYHNFSYTFNNSTQEIIQKHRTTYLIVNLPYDDYNFSRFKYSSIDPEFINSQDKHTSVFLYDTRKEKNNTEKPLALSFSVKKDTNKELMDNATKNSEQLGIIAIGLGLISLFIFFIPFKINTINDPKNPNGLFYFFLPLFYCIILGLIIIVLFQAIRILLKMA